MILTLTGGGAERQLAYLAPELSRRGHDVHVAFAQPGVNSRLLNESPVALHHLRLSAKYDPRLATASLTLLRRLRPDVLQTWLTHMDIVGGGASRLLNIPWVLSERSAALSYPPTLLNRMRAAAGRRATLIVANSHGGKDYWTAQDVPASRIDVVPNFVPATQIALAGPLQDARILPEDELVIHVGRLSPEKNLALLVDALSLVFRLRPRARFAFCGEGPLMDELTLRIEAEKLADRVIFAGFVKEIGPWLKRSSAVVAVSLCEGHPNAVLEAMAAGVPVVVSDIPAYRAILPDAGAFFVDGRNVQGIAAGIVQALEDRPGAESRAGHAKTALGEQSISMIAEHYEAAYRRAIAYASRRN
jgi:glycosyltransferase involved in cell wall biosynthesis